MYNPYEIIDRRLSAIEKVLQELRQTTHASTPAPVEETPLTVQQAADLLDVTPATVYDLVHKGKIPSHRPGKRLYFIRAELMQWVKNGRRSTTEELAAIASQRATRQPRNVGRKAA